MSFTDYSHLTMRLREIIAREPASCSPTEFNDLALALFRLQFNANLPYQRYCARKGHIPDTVTNWAQIPAVPIHAFKEFELTCLPPDVRTAVFHSSGTTEQIPSRHFHSKESLAIYEASLLKWFHISVLSQATAAKTRMFFLTPPPEQVPHSSLVHMFSTLRKTFAAPDSKFLGCIDSNGAWQIDFQQCLSMSGSKDPVILFGTAFNFVNLLDFLESRQFHLPAGSMVFETGGYKGRSRTIPKPELHALLKSRLGIDKIVSEYGMCELSSQGYDLGDGLFRFPPWACLQIISPETGRELPEGERGLIRVFDLANVYSVMAIQTEDIGLRRGDRFELLGRAAMAEARGCSLVSA